MNHLTEQQLVLYHYGDADDGVDTVWIEEHLHACPACQADFDHLRRALSAVELLPVPDRPDGYGASVWARIQPSLEHEAGGWREHLFAALSPRRLALAGAAATLIVVALVAGRILPRQPAALAPPPSSTHAPAGDSQTASADRERVQERVLRVAVGDLLERSQMTLTELVNNPSGATVDISDEQERVRDLVTENRLYRQTALTTGEPAVASVLDDLERVLIEVANGPSTLSPEEFGRVRKRIEQQGIIFKVRVFGERVREGETPSPASAGIRG
jgi:predicted anti-sigma-YlaC factor YlaD